METLGPGPSPRANHAATRFGSTLFVFGGWNGVHRFADLHVLDTSARPLWLWVCPRLSDRWTTCRVPAQRRGRGARWNRQPSRSGRVRVVAPACWTTMPYSSAAPAPAGAATTTSTCSTSVRAYRLCLSPVLSVCRLCLSPVLSVVACAYGLCLWPVPVDCAYRLFLVFVACAYGLCLWPVPIACAYRLCLSPSFPP